MSETLAIVKGTRKEKYISLLPQLKSLIGDEVDATANAANISAALRKAFNFFWVGFYFVKSNELVLGPFQGEIACTRIQIGKGVCGTAWQQENTIIVADVDKFPGHIACSSNSRSEIVVPVFQNQKIVAVLDVDSDQLNDFSEVDKIYLEQITLLFSGSNFNF